jgi:hypothetical protein
MFQAFLGGGLIAFHSEPHDSERQGTCFPVLPYSCIADPIPIAASIGSLLSVCLKLSQSLNTLYGKYKSASLGISLLSTECSITSTAPLHMQRLLSERPDILSSRATPQSELTVCFESAMLGVAATLSVLDNELARLTGKSSLGSFGFKLKARYLWNEDLFREISEQLRDQQASIAFC